MEQLYFEVKCNGVIPSNLHWYNIFPTWMVYYLSRDEFYLMSYLISYTQTKCMKQLEKSGGVYGQSFHLTHKEMAEEIGSSPSAIKRVLTSLEQLGLIIKKRYGNGNQYCPDYQLILDMTNAIWDHGYYPYIVNGLRKRFKNANMREVVDYVKDFTTFNPNL